MGSRLLAAIAALGLLTASACGTRLSDEEFATAGAGAGGPESAVGPGATLPGGRPAGSGATSTTVQGGGGPGATAPGGGPAPGPGGAPADPNAPANAGPNQASDVGVTEDTIRIGTIVAENGVLGDAFAPSARGLRAWVSWINDHGGIAGRTIDLHTCDDREDRARNLECARNLVEQEQVFALIGANSRAANGSSQYLNDAGVPVLGVPITNAFWRFPHYWSVYPEGYPRDGQTVGHNGQLINQTGYYRWFRDQFGINKAAVFAYDIPESAQAADFLVQGLEMEGFEVERYDVSFAAPSFDQPVADMQRAGTQIIFDAMDDGANRRLCDAMDRRGFTVTAKVSTVVAFGNSIGTDFNETCRNSIFITGDSRPFTDTSVPAIADFNAAMETYQPGVELHQWALESWAMGVMLRDYLTAAGPAPTLAGFEEFMRGLDDYTSDGIFLSDQEDFQPRDYDSPTRRHCFSVSRWQDDAGGWVLATDPWPACYDDAKQFPTDVREQGV